MPPLGHVVCYWLTVKIHMTNDVIRSRVLLLVSIVGLLVAIVYIVNTIVNGSQ